MFSDVALYLRRIFLSFRKCFIFHFLPINESKIQFLQLEMIKKIALIALLCALTFQHTVLAASGAITTVIVNPPGQQIVPEPWHSTYSSNKLPGAQWVWKSGGQGWLDGDTVQFETIFFVDCTSGKITLKITADNEFSASLNGGAPVTGNDWNTVYSFTVSGVIPGVNKLQTTVVNRHDHTPAALIFLIEQDRSGCPNLRNY